MANNPEQKNYAVRLLELGEKKQLNRRLRGAESGRARLEKIKQVFAGVQKIIEEIMIEILAAPELLMDDLESALISSLNKFGKLAKKMTEIDDRVAESLDQNLANLLGTVESIPHSAKANSVKRKVDIKSAEKASLETRTNLFANCLSTVLEILNKATEIIEGRLASQTEKFTTKSAEYDVLLEELTTQAEALKKEVKSRKENPQALQKTRETIKKVVSA